MLTNRGRWLISICTCGALGGLVFGKQVLALLSLSLLVWIFIEWLLFRWRFELQSRHLYCEREVNRSSSATGTLWTHRAAKIRVQVKSDASIRIPFIRFEDDLPENMKCVQGENSIDTIFHGRGPVTFEFSVRALGIGRVEMHGVIAYIADMHGLFFAQRFLPMPQSFRVLPTCVEVEATYPTVKRPNAMPPPGIHRLRQGGLGSELLELREYVSGDPPKSIAWKVSARRDTLMTRVYESEVPVRTVLFVDRSYGTQVGPYGSRPLDQMVLMAGAIAQSAMSVRDPVGLTVFDDKETRTLDAGRGERHFFRLLETLTECSSTAQPPPPRYTTKLHQLAWTTATNRYPDLMDNRINRLPFTFFPIFPYARWRFKQRSRLAALMTELYSLHDDAPIRLAHDDKLMAIQLQKFLIDSGYAWTEPVVERRGQEIHDWHGKFDTITEALTSTVARARDNELYVLLIDLIDHSGTLGRLRQAVRMARARHHSVAVICPWTHPKRPHTAGIREVPLIGDADQLLAHSEWARVNAAAARLKRKLKRLGVPIGFASDQRSMQMVLTEAELARSGRLARR